MDPMDTVTRVVDNDNLQVARSLLEAGVDAHAMRRIVPRYKIKANVLAWPLELGAPFDRHVGQESKTQGDHQLQSWQDVSQALPDAVMVGGGVVGWSATDCPYALRRSCRKHCKGFLQ